MAPKRPSAAAEAAKDEADATSSSAPRRSSRTSTGGAASTATPAGSTSTEAKAKSPTKDKDGETVEEKKDEAAPPAAKKAKTAAGTTPSGSVLKVGDQVPDFELIDDEEKTVSIKALYEEQGLVIFSYPKANTGGCTTQAKGYRDIHDQFTAIGWRVLGLSTDKPSAQASWKKSQKLPYSLLSDPKRELLNTLGSTESKKRCHWVIEKGGRLSEQDLGVKPASDPTNAFSIVKALSAVAEKKAEK